MRSAAAWEVRHGQIQNAQERAFEGEDEVWITQS